jgi:hypothetical protein
VHNKIAGKRTTIGTLQGFLVFEPRDIHVEELAATYALMHDGLSFVG